jgi:5,6-dimethylbenzimidazole synthase
MTSKHSYSEDEKAAVYKTIAERRDIRHFNGLAIDEGIFQKILSTAHMAPSVGLMQPWRSYALAKSMSFMLSRCWC